MSTKPITIHLAPPMQRVEIKVSLAASTAEHFQSLGQKQGLSVEEAIAQVLEAVTQMQLVKAKPTRGNHRLQ